MQRPEVDLEMIDLSYTDCVKYVYVDLSGNVRILALTHDLGIPVFTAVSRLDKGILGRPDGLRRPP